jgi:hypothetical protein
MRDTVLWWHVQGMTWRIEMHCCQRFGVKKSEVLLQRCRFFRCLNRALPCGVFQARTGTVQATWAGTVLHCDTRVCWQQAAAVGCAVRSMYTYATCHTPKSHGTHCFGAVPANEWNCAFWQNLCLVPQGQCNQTWWVTRPWSHLLWYVEGPHIMGHSCGVCASCEEAQENSSPICTAWKGYQHATCLCEVVGLFVYLCLQAVA